MFEILNGFIELRGMSALSAILIMFLYKLDLDQHNQIKELEKKLEQARSNLDKKIEKYLEDNNNLIVELKIDVGKLSQSIKSICISLDDVKKELRDKRC